MSCFASGDSQACASFYSFVFKKNFEIAQRLECVEILEIARVLDATSKMLVAQNKRSELNMAGRQQIAPLLLIAPRGPPPTVGPQNVTASRARCEQGDRQACHSTRRSTVDEGGLICYLTAMSNAVASLVSPTGDAGPDRPPPLPATT